MATTVSGSSAPGNPNPVVTLVSARDLLKEFAVDRNTTTGYTSVSNVYQPFWIIDLGEIRDVYEVRILPHEYGSFFSNIEIRLGMNLLTTGNFSSYVLLATYPGPYTWSDMVYLSCYSEGVPGRYLSVQKMLSNNATLAILEVEVYATKNPSRP
ncbi:uncharacterized protein LOC135209825 [Macrobrachium nipponense]|uniref:uncharacterized protein LOC135209825 n=1 Tax=Macrobrachium nipponense TaxID=159736 RepID=UPI0030C7C4F6